MKIVRSRITKRIPPSNRYRGYVSYIINLYPRYRNIVRHYRIDNVNDIYVNRRITGIFYASHANISRSYVLNRFN